MSADPMLLVYDGACPLCSNYVRMLRLREAAGPVELVDARGDHPVVSTLGQLGYDLDEGMALVRGYGSQEQAVAHGDECIHQLALLTTPVGVFNRVSASVLRSERRSKLIYPILRSGRNTALWLLGRRRLSKA